MLPQLSQTLPGRLKRSEWTVAQAPETQALGLHGWGDAPGTLFHASLLSQLTSGARAKEHATLVAFLADFSPLDWPVAVRLDNQGIHSAYQLRRTDFRVLLQMFPEASQHLEQST